MICIKQFADDITQIDSTFAFIVYKMRWISKLKIQQLYEITLRLKEY